jgi:predicted GH43/DUF377 family glycosyl hydrolase
MASVVKKGVVYNKCHCQLPIVIDLGDKLRAYFSDRDKNNKSFIRCIDLNPLIPNEILAEPQTVLTPSLDFDQDGVMTSCIVNKNGLFWLYYTGWKIIQEVPYQHSIGIAVSADGLNFEKIKEPILMGNKSNNYICSSCFVLNDEMWFISGHNCHWHNLNGTLVPLYKMRYAKIDGTTYHQQDVFFPRKSELEIFSRPFVIKYSDKYCMWTTYMTMQHPKRYSLGYAESDDGLIWNRQDEKVGLALSTQGWDSEMMAFAWITRNYFFYSGNGFGKDGFGYAII